MAFPDKKGGLGDVLSVSGIKEKGFKRVNDREHEEKLKRLTSPPTLKGLLHPNELK